MDNNIERILIVDSVRGAIYERPDTESKFISHYKKYKFPFYLKFRSGVSDKVDLTVILNDNDEVVELFTLLQLFQFNRNKDSTIRFYYDGKNSSIDVVCDTMTAIRVNSFLKNKIFTESKHLRIHTILEKDSELIAEFIEK